MRRLVTHALVSVNAFGGILSINECTEITATMVAVNKRANRMLSGPRRICIILSEQSGKREHERNGRRRFAPSPCRAEFSGRVAQFLNDPFSLD